VDIFGRKTAKTLVKRKENAAPEQRGKEIRSIVTRKGRAEEGKGWNHHEDTRGAADQKG